MASKDITSEKVLEKSLAKQVEALGGWAIKLPAYLISGLPDRLILMPHGRAYFAEVKSTGKTPTPLQQLIIKKIKKLGFEVFTISNDTTLAEAINKIRG